MLVFSAADFEDFLEPRPDLPSSMEQELKPIVTLLAQNRWPFRLHATYDETIGRALDVYEDVNREVPLKGLHWFIDHAETITERNMERIRALGGGIAIQNRMAFQGEYFSDRYGAAALRGTPPIAEMLQMGIPVGAGTDATRVASYNPFISLYWLVSGKTVGGLSMYSDTNRQDRMEALRLWTVGSSWFSNDEGKKGAIVPGQLADLAVLTATTSPSRRSDQTPRIRPDHRRRQARVCRRGVLRTRPADPARPARLVPRCRRVITNWPHDVTVMTDILFYWRQSLQDGVYSVPGFLIRPAGNSRARFVGYQPGTEIRWQIDRHAYLQLDYGVFFSGPFLRQTMPGRNLNYLALWAGYKF